MIGGVSYHTLVIANDNDFMGHVVDGNHPGGIDNPNKFFVFAIPPTSLPAFEAQAFGHDGEE